MEDSRDKLVIIMAGYSEEMNQLLNVNSGLKSRIPHQIIFPDYESAELLEIFIQIVQDNGFELTDSAKVNMKDKFQEIYAKKDSSFGNGREVRNLFEQIKLKQSTRIVSSNLSEDLQVITEDDVLV